MGVVLADDLAQFGQGRDVPVVGPHLPDNSAFSVDYADDVCLAAAPHNMVRMEPLVTLVKPSIRTDVRHGVDVKPVGAAPIFVPVGMAVYRVARLAAEPEVIEMVARQPVPHDLAVPGHLNNVFIFKQFIGDLRFEDIAVRQDERTASIHQRHSLW